MQIANVLIVVIIINACLQMTNISLPLTLEAPITRSLTLLSLNVEFIFTTTSNSLRTGWKIRGSKN